MYIVSLIECPYCGNSNTKLLTLGANQLLNRAVSLAYNTLNIHYKNNCVYFKNVENRNVKYITFDLRVAKSITYGKYDYEYHKAVVRNKLYNR